MLEKVWDAFKKPFLSFVDFLKPSHAHMSEPQHEDLTRVEKVKILRDANALIQRDEKIRELYEKLSSLPKDGTQKRKFERSEIQTKILKRCQNLNIATGVISLAEIKSRKMNEVNSTKRKI